MKDRIPVVIDCDGQIDSFWGLAGAAASDCFDIKAVTCSAGKQPAESSFQNVLDFVAFLGLDVPVYKGSARPVVLYEQPPQWPRFGEDGKCGLPFGSGATFAPGAAWDALYDIAVDCGGALRVLCFAPLTNLALALFRHETLPSYIQKIVFAGGSGDFGNYSATVEINMAADPEAARAVYRAGIDIDLVGCDAQRRSMPTVDDVRDIAGSDGQTISEYFLRSCMAADAFRRNELYLGPLLAVASQVDDTIVAFERRHVTVEVKSSLCRGRTTPHIMYSPRGYVKNTNVATAVDIKAYEKFTKAIIGSYFRGGKRSK